MAAIEELIGQIADPALRERIAAQVAKLKNPRMFGLTFEDHLPELVRLPKMPARAGSRVVLKDGSGSESFRVQAERNGKKLVVSREPDGETRTVDRDGVVVVKAFGEPIYPALTAVDAVERSPGKPWHTVINADNYHALQLLQYGYQSRFDLIYIDPPYNTGARDWKYNNDYVDKVDTFRHSKWLAMMKKRLALAETLLKEDGVLVVTIDEHEVHHLGTLLEDMFKQAARQMATIVINQKGVAQGRLARVEEYAMFVFKGQSRVPAYHDDLLSGEHQAKKNQSEPRWERLLRGGSGSRRIDRKDLFYPIFVDPKTKTITGVGDPLPFSESPDLSKLADRTVAWPIRTDGSFGRYQAKPDTLRALMSKGFVKLGTFDAKRNTWTVLYLNAGTRKRIENGEIKIVGTDPTTGSVEIEYAGEEAKKRNVKTVWHRAVHDSGIYGSSVLKSLIGNDINFAFPKSIYAVRDTLGAIVREKPNALILDFFGGSGTTLHATAMLNAEDGGSRRCILVTNNEVECDLADRLKKEGLQQGDDEYERHGIARAVAWPRCKAAVTGVKSDGTGVTGEYVDGRPFSEGFEENAAFFEMGFLELGDVSRGEGFESILPILWMIAGCRGPYETSKGSGKWFIPKANPFAVLLKEDDFGAFRQAVAARADITHAFLVTDSTESFHDMRQEMGRSYQCLQLYRSYIDTFRINLAEPGGITSGGVPTTSTAVARGASDAL